MAAAVRLNLLLLVAVTFQLSPAAACLAEQPHQRSPRESREMIGDAPAGEAPSCVKDEKSRRRLAEICSAENCRLLATETPAFAADVNLWQPRSASAERVATAAVSLQTEQIRLQV